MNERRGHWYLLTGTIIGIAIGLSIAWGITPVDYVAPSSLRPDFKDEYRYMIAAAYGVNDNLGRARARLALLEDTNAIQALNDQSARMLANNISADVVRSITELARELQENATPTSPPPQTETSIPPLPSPTLVDENTALVVSTLAAAETPIPEAAATLAPTTTPLPPAIFTLTPRPTTVPTFTSGPPFSLVQSPPPTFCEVNRPGLLQIFIEDASGEPVAGVELVITWAGGEERFFSGLKPELGNGYADFVMSPNVEYALSLSNGSTRVTGLSAPACEAEDGSSYPGGTRLDFEQP